MTSTHDHHPSPDALRPAIRFGRSPAGELRRQFVANFSLVRQDARFHCRFAGASRGTAIPLMCHDMAMLPHRMMHAAACPRN
jgi:hypothetical protein